MSEKIICKYFLIAAIATCANALAADGDLDPSFGSGGIARSGLVDAGSALVSRVAVQADGKIVLCGTRNTDGITLSDFFVERFSANGSPDTSFSFDGMVTIDFDHGVVSDGDTCTAIALQTDGKIVVAGLTRNAEFTSAFAVARLDADGTLDPDFGAGTGKATFVFDAADVDNAATAVAIQGDGKIVVSGVHGKGDTGDFGVIRLLANGTLDTSFATKGKASIAFDLPGSASKTDIAYDMAIDSTGNIIVAGFATGPTVPLIAVVRLTSNGMPDANFNANGRETIDLTPAGSATTRASEATSLLIQHDGRIVLAGICDSSTTSQSNLDLAAVRIFPDGSLDPSFGNNGKASVGFDLANDGNDFAFAVVEQTDGKLLLGGSAARRSGGISGAIARLDKQGRVDTSFGVLGKQFYDFGAPTAISTIFGLALQGKQPVVFGFESTGGVGADYVVMRLQNDDQVFRDGFE